MKKLSGENSFVKLKARSVPYYKKILNHLGLGDVKRKPPPRANSPPTESFIIYDESSSPGADDYITPLEA